MAEHDVDSPDEKSLGILRDSLAEAQMTVRAYDTKAQIVGVGYIFALGIVAEIGTLLPEVENDTIPVVIVSWGVVMLPIFLFGYVLYPTRKTAPRLEQQHAVERVLYVEPERHGTIEGLRAAVTYSSAVDEYCFEVLKVAKLRELKRKRFLRAMFAAAVAFLVMFLSHFARGRM